MIAEFHNPHAFWLLLLIPPYLWVARRRVTTCAVRYPTIRNLQRLPRTLRQRCRFLLPLLRTAAMILLIVVLARPQQQIASEELPSEGIGIALVLDKSGSMGDENGKLMYNGKLSFRFDVAKEALQKFVAGDGKDLKGRPNDLIGLITFATYPQMEHPFSLDHTSLLNAVEHMSAEKPFLDKLGRPTDKKEDAALLTDEHGRQLYYPNGEPARRPNPMQMTSLKSAVEYSASKILLLTDDLQRPVKGLRPYHLKSKVMILLTDGEPTVADANKAPDFPDEATIKQLVDNGVKVYFIQILARERYVERPDGSVAVMPMQFDPRYEQLVKQAIDEAQQLARRTGGEHFLASSGDDIRRVYRHIDEMERSDVGGRTVFSREERYRPALLAALALLAAEVVLGLTWLRRAP